MKPMFNIKYIYSVTSQQWTDTLLDRIFFITNISILPVHTICEIDLSETDNFRDSISKNILYKTENKNI